MESQTHTEIPAFSQHLGRLGYSASTVAMLPSCLAAFIAFIGKPAIGASPQDITAYHAYLEQRPNRRRPGGLSESHIHHHIYALRLFFAWKEEEGLIRANPASGLRFPSPSSPPREIVTKDEAIAMREAAESHRERAIMALFYGCGLRRAEGVALNIGDIGFRKGAIYVRSGKGGKRRIVPMGGKVAADLEAYALGERQPAPKENAFLLNRSGKRIHGNACNGIIKALAARAGVEKGISLHSMRHAIATHLLEGGMPIEAVRSFLGHRHLESTQAYARVQNKLVWGLAGI